jgi:hypothetical protein
MLRRVIDLKFKARGMTQKKMVGWLLEDKEKEEVPRNCRIKTYISSIRVEWKQC